MRQAREARGLTQMALAEASDLHYTYIGQVENGRRNVALLKLRGLPGLRDGLAVLRGLIDQYWDQLYPRLDPDDNNDPLERMNILAAFG